MSEKQYGYEDASRGADLIRSKLLEHGMDLSAPLDGVVLGSGLGNFAEEYLDLEKAGDVSGPVVIPYNEIYKALGRPAGLGAVQGHDKKVIIAPLQGTGEKEYVMALKGREHLYQGVPVQRATFFLRIMQSLGVERLIASNAAGIVTPETLEPPALVLINSSLDRGKGASNPLTGENDERFGPQFPHKGDLYPAATRAIVRDVAKEIGVKLHEGTYIRSEGPDYESPEEVYEMRRDLEQIWTIGRRIKGEDRFQGKPVVVVGMSSTYEMLVAQHATQCADPKHRAFLKGRALISAATNYSGSVGPDGFVEPSSHDEVQENAAIVQEAFGRLVRDTILRMRK